MLRKGFTSCRDFFIIGSLILDAFIQCQQDCWTSFDAKEHFKTMDELDDRLKEGRYQINKNIRRSLLSNNMYVPFQKNRGVAERARHEAEINQNVIPAGINLGGYCIMRMPNSLLFFHRMKLRNNTVFRVKSLVNRYHDLRMEIQLMLQDLHLFGSYDMAITKYVFLEYVPTFGQVEFLLKNVQYNVDARYRFLKNRFTIEMVISNLIVDDVLMTYNDKNSTSTINLQRKNIDVFIERLQIDLDKWLKDYFNDYLMYDEPVKYEEFFNYNREKTLALNKFTDKAIGTIIKRIQDIKADAVQLPRLIIQTTDEKVNIGLNEGVLRGLDSIYRRGIATGYKEHKVRKVDTVVGFSDLKVIYKFDINLSPSSPPVTGTLILTADELTAHMALALVKEPESAELSFQFLEQAKPESLTVEGPASRMISNFKYILERHVIAILSNILMHNIKNLGTLDKCDPLLPPYSDPFQNNIPDRLKFNSSYDEATEKSNASENNFEGSSESDPNKLTEKNITSTFEEAPENDNTTGDDLPAPPLPTHDGSEEQYPQYDDNITANITNSFETALESSNVTNEKTLIGDHGNTLRQKKRHIRRPPLLFTLKRNVKHFTKAVKRNK